MSNSNTANTKAKQPRKVVLVPPAQITVETKQMERRLIVKPVGALFSVGYEGGGLPPLPLTGRWTSASGAEKAIREFLRASHRKQSDS